MTTFYDEQLQNELNQIPELTRKSYMLTASIANRIDAIMHTKNISKKQLAELTHKRPSEITKWLGGGYNFTCKTITLISNALGEPIIQVVN